MPTSDTEIVVDDPTAPADDSPAVTTARTAEVVVYLLLLALATLLGFDNWRSGMGWAKDGPQTGYVPFYLCVILAGASVYGLGVAFLKRSEAAKTFVTRDQLRRVMQVFIPTEVAKHATNKYLGVLVAAKYARVLNEFPRDRSAPGEKKLTTRALEELTEGDVAYRVVPRRRTE